MAAPEVFKAATATGPTLRLNYIHLVAFYPNQSPVHTYMERNVPGVLADALAELRELDVPFNYCESLGDRANVLNGYTD